MLTRRALLSLLSILLPTAWTASRAFAASERDGNGKQLGDTGFMHDELHQFYPTYFDTIKCPCKQGECRPTRWQRDPKDGRTIQVLIDQVWVSATKTTDIRDQRDIPKNFPKALLRFSAHACAYGNPATVTCIWVIDARV